MTDIFGQFSALDIPAQENNFQSNSQHFISTVTGVSLTKGEHEHRYLFDFNLQIYFASP